MRKTSALAMRLLGVGLFIFILTKIDLGQVVAVIKKADLGMLVLAFVLLVPQYDLKAMRWRKILSLQRIGYSRMNSLLVYFSANFIGFVTPGRLGEAVKALYLKRDAGVEIVRGLPSVIMDRIFDVYVLTIAAASGMIRGAMFSSLGFGGYLVLGLILIVPLFFLRASFRVSCLKWLKKIRVFAARGGKLDALFAELDYFKPGKLIVPLLQTLAAYVILFWAADLIAGAAGIHVGLVNISCFVAIANIVSFLPVSVAGLGTRDASLIYLFSTIGRNQEEALAFSLLLFLVFYLGGGLLGFIAYTIKPIGLKAMKPGRAETD